MKKYPSVTVITPSFNQAKFLKATIESVLNQNYRNLQYIVIDGKSTDNSVEIIKNYSSKIDYWVSEPDRGQSDAINKGLCRAKGDIVTWLNSDDLLAPGALEAVAAAWLETPDLALLSGECIRIGPDNEFLFWHVVPRQTRWLAKLGLIYIDQPGTFWSREMFKNANVLNSNLTGLMDHDLWYRIVLSGGKTRRIRKCTAAFRIHPESKTEKLQDTFQKESEMLRKYHCKNLKSVSLLSIFSYRIWKFINGDYVKKFWYTNHPDREILNFLNNTKIHILK